MPRLAKVTISAPGDLGNNFLLTEHGLREVSVVAVCKVIDEGLIPALTDLVLDRVPLDFCQNKKALAGLYISLEQGWCVSVPGTVDGPQFQSLQSLTLRGCSLDDLALFLLATAMSSEAAPVRALKRLELTGNSNMSGEEGWGALGKTLGTRRMPVQALREGVEKGVRKGARLSWCT